MLEIENGILKISRSESPVHFSLPDNETGELILEDLDTLGIAHEQLEDFDNIPWPIPSLENGKNSMNRRIFFSTEVSLEDLRNLIVDFADEIESGIIQSVEYI